MTIVLLSCECKVEYKYSPPNPGDELFCPIRRAHDIVKVMAEFAVLLCLDCDYRREYDSLAKHRICVTAMKHRMKKGHTTLHYNPVDGPGTMCLHVVQASPEFEISVVPGQGPASADGDLFGVADEDDGAVVVVRVVGHVPSTTDHDRQNVFGSRGGKHHADGCEIALVIEQSNHGVVRVHGCRGPFRTWVDC